MTEIWNKYVGNTLPGSNENILTQAINTSSQSTTYKLADIASKSIEEKQSIFDEYFKQLTQYNYSDYINKQIEPLLNILQKPVEEDVKPDKSKLLSDLLSQRPEGITITKSSNIIFNNKFAETFKSDSEISKRTALKQFSTKLNDMGEF